MFWSIIFFVCFPLALIDTLPLCYITFLVFKGVDYVLFFSTPTWFHTNRVARCKYCDVWLCLFFPN